MEFSGETSGEVVVVDGVVLLLSLLRWRRKPLCFSFLVLFYMYYFCYEGWNMWRWLDMISDGVFGWLVRKSGLDICLPGYG